MNRHRGPWVASLFIAAVVFVPSPPARAANFTVIEQGVQYVPAQVDVTVGDTVTWIYQSSPPTSQGHTVTFNDRDLNPNCPPTLLLNDCQRSPSDRVSRTFTTPGTYAYYCKIHRGQGMTGVVVVSAATSTSTTAPASSTTATVKASTTTTTRAATSSTTSTTRVLATSSTVVKSTTTTSDPSSALLPGAPPPLSGDDSNSNAAGRPGGSSHGSDSGTVALIVGLLLAVSAGGGYLLWRIRPGRA
jgi:plastocyanin